MTGQRYVSQTSDPLKFEDADYTILRKQFQELNEQNQELKIAGQQRTLIQFTHPGAGHFAKMPALSGYTSHAYGFAAAIADPGANSGLCTSGAAIHQAAAAFESDLIALSEAIERGDTGNLDEVIFVIQIICSI